MQTQTPPTETTTPVARTEQQTANAFFDKSPEVVETAIIKETPPVETPPPAEKPPAEETKPDETKPPEVPETYELEIKDGYKVSEADIAEVKALAVEAKLTKDQAQKFLDSKSQAIDKYMEKQQSDYVELTKKWISDIRSDKEMGGANLKNTELYAKRAMDEIASPALKKILDDTGYGNHPELVRAFARLGKRISPDVMVQAPKSPAAAKSFEETFYGSDEKQT